MELLLITVSDMKFNSRKERQKFVDEGRATRQEFKVIVRKTVKYGCARGHSRWKKYYLMFQYEDYYNSWGKGAKVRKIKEKYFYSAREQEEWIRENPESEILKKANWKKHCVDGTIYYLKYAE